MTGDTITNAFRVQVLHYTIDSSLFDIVFVAVVRFLFLITFYGIFSINHWIVIAVNSLRIWLFAIHTNSFHFAVNYNRVMLIFDWKSLLLQCEDVVRTR